MTISLLPNKSFIMAVVWNLMIPLFLFGVHFATSYAQTINTPLSSPSSSFKNGDISSRKIQRYGFLQLQQSTKRRINEDVPCTDDQIYTWNQLGLAVGGTSSDIDENFGYSVALSEDGNIMVVSSANGDISLGIGYIRIFERDEASTTGWTQIGYLKGEEVSDAKAPFYFTVAISSNGDIVAYGARWSDDVGYKSGHVRVFQRSSLSPDGYEQIGSNIIGQNAGDTFGFSLDLSADGSILAVGAPSNRGVVKIYERNTTSTIGWSQIGEDLGGTAKWNEEKSGHVASLSSNGDVVALVGKEALNETDRFGYVRVYKRSNTSDWTQLGETITGNSYSDSFITSPNDEKVLSLSGDGETFASITDDREVRIFEWDPVSRWHQVGGNLKEDVDVDGYTNSLASSVAISHHGDIVAIGLHDTYYNGLSYARIMRIYQRDSTLPLGWRLIGEITDTDKNSGGSAVSLSANGYIAAVSSAYQKGHVQVFEASCTNITNIPSSAPSSTPTSNIDDDDSSAFSAMHGSIMTVVLITAFSVVMMIV